MRVAVFSWLLAACGGGGGQPGPVTSAPAQLVPELPPGDVVVASVNGRPVLGSCVAAQVARQRGAEGREKARDQALRECIDFELLAQAAEQRGLATHPEVVDATHQALARRLVDQWEATHTRDAMRKEIDALFAAGTDADRNQPEWRDSYTLVARVLKPDDDAKARRLMDSVHAKLANETGLFPTNLRDALSQVPHAKLEPKKDGTGVIIDGIEVATNQDLDYTALKPTPYERSYTDALFAIPEVGRISPVIKTRFGYHVILLTDVKPAEVITYAKAEPRMHEHLQRKAFRAWVEEIKTKHDVEGPHFDRLPAEDAP